MRRSLVLTDETARHPFLASLPPHVRGGTMPRKARAGWRLSADDFRGFLATYIASLVVFGVFIA